jgi:beta-galactosidase beta subunit
MFNDFDEEEMMNKIQHYIEIGAIRVAGFTEDGEAIFELNEDTTKDLAPELWEAHEQYIDAELLDLLDNDLMQVEYDEDLNATFNFTLEGYEIAKSKGIIPLDTIEDFDL